MNGSALLHAFLRSTAAAFFVLSLVWTPAAGQIIEHPLDPNSATTESPPEGILAPSNLPLPVIVGSMDGIATNNTWIPPDVHGASGAKGVIQVVNSRVRYIGKYGYSTSWSAPVEFSAFFPGTAGSLFDPRADFDPATGRYYVLALERLSNASYFNLAVSKDDDPASSGSSEWHYYRINVTDVQGATSYGIDFPGLGHDGQAIYVTGNFWSLPLGTGSTFDRARIYAINKASANSGTLSFTVTATPPGFSNGYTLQPATVTGSGNPGNVGYFAEVMLSFTNRVRVWALSSPLSSPSLASASILTVNHGGATTVNAPQLGTSQVVSVVRAGVKAQGNAFWYAGSMWFCHTAGGSTPDHRSIVYYYKVATNGFPGGTPTVTEAGGIDGGTGVWNFHPAIGANAYGDVCLVYGQSSASTYPRIVAVARNSAASTFSPPLVLKTSSSYYVNDDNSDPRWGDYSTVSPDPMDHRMWVASEYSRGSGSVDNWGTWWTKIAIPDAQWTAEGTALKAGQGGTTFFLRALSDGAGGAYVTWPNTWYDPVPGMRLNRITGDGAIPQGWPIGGLEIAPGSSGSQTPNLAADIWGGVYVAWYGGASDIRVQRVNSDGTVAAGWPTAGVQVSASGGFSPFVAPDAAGGVFVAWYPIGGSSVRLQRLTSTGAIASGWPSGGLVVQSGISQYNDNPSPFVTPDQFGGAIISYSNSGTVVVKRIQGDGTPHPSWPSGGVQVPGYLGDMATDQSGGAYVLYQKVVASSFDMFATRLTGSGTFPSGWSVNGVVLSNQTGSQVEPRIVADGQGGFVAAWKTGDYYQGEISAIRVRGDGQLANGWPVNGVAITDPYQPHAREGLRLVADGVGGAVLIWQELRNMVGCEGPIVGCDYDIFGSRISGGGVIDPSVPAGGKAVSAVLGVQQSPGIVYSSAGRAIAAWEDTRISPTYCQYCGYEVYAQQMTYDGISPGAPPAFYASNGRHSLAVVWQYPGDDGQTGNATEYQVRYSQGLITDENFFNTGTVLSSGPAPAQGTEQCAGMMNLPSCTTYWFAFKARDDAGNWSAATVIQKSTKCSGSQEVFCADGLIAYDDDDRSDQLPTELSFGIKGAMPARDRLSFDVQIPRRFQGQAFDLSVFDVAGRRVHHAPIERAQPGRHVVRWDLRDTGANRVRPGAYFARLRVGTEEFRRTVVVVD